MPCLARLERVVLRLGIVLIGIGFTLRCGLGPTGRWRCCWVNVTLRRRGARRVLMTTWFELRLLRGRRMFRLIDCWSCRLMPNFALACDIPFPPYLPNWGVRRCVIRACRIGLLGLLLARCRRWGLLRILWWNGGGRTRRGLRFR